MKKRILPILLVLCLMAGLTTVAFAAETGTDKIQLSGQRLYSEAYEVLEQVNAQRAENDLDPLVMDETLLEAAMLRAAECAVYFDHTRPDGSSCFTAASGWMNGENIAAGQANPTAAMNSWMNSSGHRANILRDWFTTVGIGVFYINGVRYWTQCFGYRPSSVAVQPSNRAVTETINISPDLVTTFKLVLSSTETDAGTSQTAKVYVANSEFYNRLVPVESSSFRWSSSNARVASVSNGTVKSLSGGTAVITAATPNGVYSVSETITVTGTQNGWEQVDGKWYFYETAS